MSEAPVRCGFEHVLTLPEGYDSRTRIADFHGMLVVAHPDFQPCIIVDNKLVPLELPHA